MDTTIDKFSSLFPVDAENFDVQLDYPSTKKLWAIRATTNDSYTYMTNNLGIWKFAIIGSTKELLMQHLNADVPDGMSAEEVSVRELLHHFRAWKLDGVYKFIAASSDYLCTEMYADRPDTLYPYGEQLVLCAVSVKDFVDNDLVCVTQNVDGVDCLVISDNCLELIGQLSKNQEYIENPWRYTWTWLPLSFILKKYDYAVSQNLVYDLRIPYALSKRALTVISDETKEKINNGEIDVVQS
jgi:hypothetical protein